MAEEVVSTATKISLFSAIIPHPGINIVKTWQGIVEIVLRAVVAVLAFVLIIPAATSQTQASSYTGAAILGQVYAAAGWLLFVAVVTLLIEAAIIAIRFLNLGLIEKYTLPLVITDAVICLVVALGLFAGATSMAVYSSTAKNNFTNLQSLASAAGATAAFGYFLLIAAVALGVWVMLAYFVLKWCTSGKYVVTSRSSDPEPSKPM